MKFNGQQMCPCPYLFFWQTDMANGFYGLGFRAHTFRKGQHNKKKKEEIGRIDNLPLVNCTINIQRK